MNVWEYVFKREWICFEWRVVLIFGRGGIIKRIWNIKVDISEYENEHGVFTERASGSRE